MTSLVPIIRNNFRSRLKLFSCVMSVLFCSILQIHHPAYGESKTSEKTIAITQIVQHPSLDLIRRGIIDELAQQGFDKGKNLKIYFDDAHGDLAIASQIAQKFVGLQPDVIIAISTPSAQTVMQANRTKEIPVVFSAISDPVGANLVTDLRKPGGFATGIIDFPPVKQQIELIKRLIPYVKRIGIIYNPGEINTRMQIHALKEYAQESGIAIIEAHASKTSEVYAATRHIVNSVQAIYIANDNTVVSALEALLKVTFEHWIPVFASDGQSVDRGATFALANNQYEVGRATGRYVAKILRGVKPGKLEVIASHKTELYINEASAKAFKLKIPHDLLKQAFKKES